MDWFWNFGLFGYFDCFLISLIVCFGVKWIGFDNLYWVFLTFSTNILFIGCLVSSILKLSDFKR